jgi:hypothetical protein
MIASIHDPGANEREERTNALLTAAGIGLVVSAFVLSQSFDELPCINLLLERSTPGRR